MRRKSAVWLEACTGEAGKQDLVPFRDRLMSVRPFTPDDWQAVNRLHREVWWPQRSTFGWAWLDANPARHDISAPSGWVAQNEAGEAIAFVGNLVQRFWLGEQRRHAASGFSIIVPRSARGQSRPLIQAALRQPNIFVAYTFNANPSAARLYPRQGLLPWPSRTHMVKLSWIVDPLACLGGRLLREIVQRAPNLADPDREHFMNRRLRGRFPVEGARPVLISSSITTLTDVAPGSAYEAFWHELRQEGRLIADRSPEILSWRLTDPDRTDPPVVLAFWRGGQITGFALAILAKGNPIEPASLEIIDLIALQDEPHAIPALVEALTEQARKLGAAKLRLQVVSEDMLRRLGHWAGRARREGGWGHCHAAFRADAPSALTWQPTPFDGDYGICQRPTPFVARQEPRSSSRRQLDRQVDPRPVQAQIRPS